MTEGEAASTLLEAGIAVRLAARGQSMKPLVRSGSLLRVVPARGEAKIGDIALVRLENGGVIIHRVVAIDGGRVTTKGDAYVTPDGAVDRSRILGRVVAVERPLPIPLEGTWARAFGRLVGWLYPKLVIARGTFRARRSASSRNA